MDFAAESTLRERLCEVKGCASSSTPSANLRASLDRKRSSPNRASARRSPPRCARTHEVEASDAFHETMSHAGALVRHADGMWRVPTIRAAMARLPLIDPDRRQGYVLQNLSACCARMRR